MRLQQLLVVLTGCVLTGCWLSARAFAVGSEGAVTVVGGGAARVCFESARFNGPAFEGVAACSEALDSGSLSADDHAATLVNRGILRVRLLLFKDALSDYDAGIALRPNLAEAYVDRGAVLIKIGRYAEAISDLSKGIALGSENLQIAYFDRGQARERGSDFAGACDDYHQALIIAPNFDAARRRSDICVLKGRPPPD